MQKFKTADLYYEKWTYYHRIITSRDDHSDWEGIWDNGMTTNYYWDGYSTPYFRLYFNGIVVSQYPYDKGRVINTQYKFIYIIEYIM